jgi:thiol-disulfide isomerase/thioredoxin
MTIRMFSFFLIILCSSYLLTGCAPDAVDIYGRPIRISDYRGKWVVINYWATWCSPCIAEIPDLNKLARYYKGKVVVLGVNISNLTNQELKDLREDYEVEYPFLSHFPIEKWGGEYENIPVTYILNPKGKLYQTLTGPQTLANFQAIMNLPPITYE